MQWRNVNFVIIHRHARACFLAPPPCNSPTESQAAHMSFIGLSGLGLLIDDMPFICYHLLKFPALKGLDLSVNSCLDNAAVAHLATLFSGETTRHNAREPHPFNCVVFVRCRLHHVLMPFVRNIPPHKPGHARHRRQQHRGAARGPYEMPAQSQNAQAQRLQEPLFLAIVAQCSHRHQH